MPASPAKPVPTPAADKARIETCFEALQNLLGTLWGRWQDEHEYEDIREYGAAIAKHLPAGFTLTAMTKRPFGFRFTLDTMPTALYAMEVTARTALWKRVK